MIKIINLNKKKDGLFSKDETSIPKKELYNKLNSIIEDLEPRDIYILDNYTNISFIAIKKNGFILKIDFFRVIISENSLIILEENQNRLLIQDFLNNFNNYQKKYNYFEFYIFEEILIFVINIFLNNLDKLIPSVNNLYNDNFVNLKNYDFFLNVQKKFIELEFRVSYVLELLNELSLNDEDMVNMYISRKNDKNNQNSDHDELEFLLENYQKRIQQILNDLRKYIKEIELMKSTISVVLVNNRNDIAIKSIQISMINLGISTSMLITSIYGMNLKNYIEDEDYFFLVIIISSGLFGVLIYLFIKYCFLV